MPLVRVSEPERVYDAEKVLGRDARSVFPSLSDERATTSGTTTIIGTSKFVTESELQAMRAARGTERAGEDECAPSKPLYQVLLERKEAKEQEFQENWASMKVGKNKPLDAEEAEFLDEMENERRAAEAKRKREENEELERFKRLQGSTNASVSVAREEPSAASARPVVAVVARKKPVARAVVVRAKERETGEEKSGDDVKPSDDAPSTGGLGALLGDYSDGTESE